MFVTVGVIDFFEIIHIDHRDTKFRCAFGNFFVKLGNFLDVSGFIFYAGQRIFVGNRVHFKNFKYHVGNLTARPLKCRKIFQNIFRRPQQRVIKIFYFVARRDFQAPHLLDIFLTSRLAVERKIPRIISQRVYRQDDMIFDERQAHCRNKNETADKQRNQLDDKSSDVFGKNIH